MCKFPKHVLCSYKYAFKVSPVNCVYFTRFEEVKNFGDFKVCLKFAIMYIINPFNLDPNLTQIVIKNTINII